MKLVGLVERRSPAVAQLGEFPLNVAKVALKVFLDGTTVAIPLRAEVGIRGQAVIGSPEEIPAEGHLHDRDPRGPAGIAPAGERRPDVGFLHRL